jgi:hypothetical protein
VDSGKIPRRFWFLFQFLSTFGQFVKKM